MFHPITQKLPCIANANKDDSSLGCRGSFVATMHVMIQALPLYLRLVYF